MEITAKQIQEAFEDAEEEFGEHKSTEFLCAIVGERLGIDYDSVIDGLIDLGDEE